jgi:hypothetical protein
MSLEKLLDIKVKTRKEAMRLKSKLKNLKKRELQLRYFEENPSSEI